MLTYADVCRCCNHAYLFDSAVEASSAYNDAPRDTQLELLVLTYADVC
jgi:hypothetical protein